MSELLFQAITGPQAGEGTEWWKLDADPTKEKDLKKGILSNGIFYVHPFKVETENFQIGNDVERIVFPSVNIKYDRIEIQNDFAIPPNEDHPGEPLEPPIPEDPYTDQQLEQLVLDVAETGIGFSTSIEELSVQDTGEISFTRQEETEGPFDFSVDAVPIYQDAYVDGNYVGVDPSKVPTFRDGKVEIQHGGTFDLTLLQLPDNALDPVYQSLIDLIPIFPDGFTVNNTYTFEFDVNEVTGSNKKDNLKGTAGRDKIEGGNGRDRLTGAGGNDYLDGGNGRDILNGAGGRCSVGTGEIDILTGGRGRDVFVLGNRHSGAFYLGNDNSDYAVITDFQRNDRIRLGTANFTLSEENTFLDDSGISIFVNNDLVGFVVGASFRQVEAAMRL